MPGATPEAILRRSRRIAVVGLSRSPAKASHRVALDLAGAGYEIIPIHPTAVEVLGRPAHRRLDQVPGVIDLVDVFRPSPDAPGWARQAVAVGAGAVWLQVGIRSAEARLITETGGLDFVEDRCTMVERRRHRLGPPAPSERRGA